MTPMALMVGTLVAAAVAILGGWAGASVAPPPPPATTFGDAPAVGRPRRRSGRPPRPPTDVEVASWCEHAARALRSGQSLTAAMTTATGDAPAMASCVSSVLDAVRRGRPLSDALTDLATDGGQSGAHVPPTAMAATVLRTCADLGGPAAGPLDRVAAMLRVRAAVADEQAAQSAQARLSARVLTVVPVALLGLLLVTDHRVRAAVTTAAGGAAIAAGLGLNLVGWWWMRRIVAAPR